MNDILYCARPHVRTLLGPFCWLAASVALGLWGFIGNLQLWFANGLIAIGILAALFFLNILWYTRPLVIITNNRLSYVWASNNRMDIPRHSIELVSLVDRFGDYGTLHFHLPNQVKALRNMPDIDYLHELLLTPPRPLSFDEWKALNPDVTKLSEEERLEIMMAYHLKHAARTTNDDNQQSRGWPK